MVEQRKGMSKCLLETLVLVCGFITVLGSQPPINHNVQHVQNPCVVNEWSPWSRLNCDTREVERSRHIIYGNYETCPEVTYESRRVLIHPPIVSKWSDWSLPDITGVMKRSRTAYGFCVRHFLGPDFPLVEKRHSNQTNFDVYQELDYKVSNDEEKIANKPTDNVPGKTNQKANDISSKTNQKADEIDSAGLDAGESDQEISKISGVQIIQVGNEDTNQETQKLKEDVPSFLKTVYKKYLIQNPKPLDRYYILPSYKVLTKPLPHVLVNHYKKSAIMNENSEVITTTTAPTTERTYWHDNGFTDYKEEYRQWYNQLLNEAVKNQTGVETQKQNTDDVWHHISVTDVFKNSALGKSGGYGSKDKSYGDYSNGQTSSGGSYGANTLPLGKNGNTYGGASKKAYDPNFIVNSQLPAIEGQYGAYDNPVLGSGNKKILGMQNGGSLSSRGDASPYEGNLSSKENSDKLRTLNIHSIKALSNYSAQDTPDDIKQRKEYLKSKTDFRDIFSILANGNAPPALPTQPDQNKNFPYNSNSRDSVVSKQSDAQSSSTGASGNGWMNNKPPSLFNVYPSASLPEHFRYPPPVPQPANHNINDNMLHKGQLSFPINPVPKFPTNDLKHGYSNGNIDGPIGHVGQASASARAVNINNSGDIQSSHKNPTTESPFDKMRNDHFLKSRGGFDNIFAILNSKKHLSGKKLHQHSADSTNGLNHHNHKVWK